MYQETLCASLNPKPSFSAVLLGTNGSWTVINIVLTYGESVCDNLAAAFLTNVLLSTC